MRNKDSDKLTYDQLMELVNSVKMYNGCDEVELIGNDKSFEELMALGFPLGEFKCTNITDFLDEARVYVIPMNSDEEDNAYA